MKPILGIDLGSVSTKLALVEGGRIVRTAYRRHLGRPTEALAVLLGGIDGWRRMQMCLTGSAARACSDAAGARPVNEVVALAAAVSEWHPDLRSVIEMGGQDSKLLLFRLEDGTSIFDDFSMNSICAAGTGSFLDQQAARLGLEPSEMGDLALRCRKPPRVAGRCSVFAKSDMIHLQQVGAPPEDIVAGLCLAVARNFKSIIASGKEFRPPVGFVGGVAASAGMVRAFGEVLLDVPGGVTVPRHFAELTAAGAALAAEEDQVFVPGDGFLQRLGAISSIGTAGRAHPPLARWRSDPPRSPVRPARPDEPVYLGLDVGSISTNVVALGSDGAVVAREYLMTAGRPLEAVKRGLSLVGGVLGADRKILAAGVTGSGRYLTGDFTGADTIVNEITAQARAAVEACPDVDTVFEIGGQDSKYIRIEHGRVVDFEMNKVCAAGTGSFLEEQAEKLGLGIRDFGPVALESPAPAILGERCTVFMESDVIAHQAAGTTVENMVGGLCYSIVQNYLHRVVGDRKPGGRILFQGGTAHNRGVVAAFDAVLGSSVTVPPHHDVTGAIGAALLARDRSDGSPSGFRGFELAATGYTQESFTCRGCSNCCEIHTVTLDDGRTLFHGGRCEKYEKSARPEGAAAGENLFETREALLLGDWRPAGAPGPRTVGIPRALWFWEYFPFFRAFFEGIGCDVALSDPSSPGIVHSGVENVAAETCFPVKIAHGHVMNLIGKGVRNLFLPSMLRAFPHEGFDEAQNCPYVSGSPYVLEASLGLGGRGVSLISPVLDFSGVLADWRSGLIEVAAGLGAGRERALASLDAAERAQEAFESSLASSGRAALERLGRGGRALVIVSRPYNGCDPAVSSGLPAKLSRMGVTVIPAEMLDLPLRRASELHPNMYWHYGQKILAAALAVREDPRLNAVYLTNFGCGPDSFIHHFFAALMAGKPFLTLEADEHAADAGMVTRCEAFMDSLSAAGGRIPAPACRGFAERPVDTAGRTIWVPLMGDGSKLLSAAARRRGIDARAMPPTDSEAVALGRAVTSGKECYPAIITSGNMMKILRGSDPSRTGFFMGTASGPCRFGQYCSWHRTLLDRMGFEDVPIVTSSSRDSYTSVPGLSTPSFQLDMLRSAACADILKSAYRRIRPYERTAGEALRAYESCISILEEAMERGESIPQAMRLAAGMMEGVARRDEPRPLILVFGEIYVRHDPYANSNTEDRIEALGGEVMPTWILEWFEFVNHTFVQRSLAARRPVRAAAGLLKGLLMRHVRNAMERPFRRLLAGRRHPSAAQVLQAAAPYMKENVGGEAVLCIGAPVALAAAGAIQGAVNILPFTCLPGTIVTAVSKSIRRDHPGLPWLNLAFDGQEDTDNEARLEAFMFQVRERHVGRQAPPVPRTRLAGRMEGRPGAGTRQAAGRAGEGG